jgi:hypothetical protein
VIALVRNRVERIFAQRLVGDRLCPGSPCVDLARDGRQSPQQLTGSGD